MAPRLRNTRMVNEIMSEPEWTYALCAATLLNGTGNFRMGAMSNRSAPSLTFHDLVHN